MSFQNLRIRSRLALGFGAMMLIIVVIGGLALSFSVRTAGSIGTMKRLSDNAFTMQSALLDVRQARSLIWYYIATGDAQALADRDAAFAKFDRQIVGLEANTLSDESRALIKGFADGVAVFKAATTAMLDMKAKGVAITSPEFTKVTADVLQAQRNYVAANEKAVQYAETRSNAATAEADGYLSQSSTWSTVTAIVGLLAGIVCAWLISRSITRPISGMTRAMQVIAGGDLACPVPALSNKDEVGHMARAVQVFKDNGLKLKETEAEAERTRQLAEQERRTVEAARAESEARQTKVVDSLAAALGRLAAGDLTCDMTEAFAPEYERLRADFNAAVAELRTVIGTIVTNAGALRSGTGEITQAADDLSRRTEQQAASLEETAAALDEITATVRKTAEGANTTHTVVTSARTEAEHGEGVVRDAVAAMIEIEKSAQEISQIIGVIDEIAFQTNLLALNAGVEAARAGDAGRGFAVVASEVRALAQRSAQAAKEIKGLISTSTSHVGRGVTLVRETGTALGRILAQVMQINSAVSEIAASAQEQASGLAQVNTAVNQMDQVTQQNAAMVEQSTAASHSLAQDTAELERLTARFKIGGATNVPAAASTRAAAPPRKPAPPASAKPLRVVGNTALKPTEEESWEEF